MMKQQYNVGDMFVIYHGNLYSIGLLTEIDNDKKTYDKYTICWFDKKTIGEYRKAGYSLFEIKTQIDRCAWEYHKVGK